MAGEIIYINEDRTLEGNFHFASEKLVNYRVDNKNYEAEIITSSDPKEIKVRINGKTHHISIQTELDVLISNMGLNIINKPNAGNINSPMPGLVIDIFIKEGDVVDEDQPLVILEAMKMENIIKANGKGVVKSIKIKKGDKVEKAQLMIEIDSEA
ncbi:acetyl-CoA carboxylase biotin carboxyl carrier protein subunit [Portibacter lacus]|uniref:Lipoyl-binding domain-containing protein n=1 Tax=Portibacter lacus TaxID=1099794 RepID=A0AA37SLW0_9BACT|nr:acetyl-CoA carboxylase biotin carboxyl carrier protein subunit [Portibacter lacus]GLR15802.1 hypothetical protein GCM10007940_04170 [Portibacter lacus]